MNSFNLLGKMFDLANDNTLLVIFCILGGLGIFLFGMNLMSSSLNSLAGSKMKTIVTKATDNMFKGFAMGILITVLVQSSSATTVIVIGLITAGLLDLKRAMPIMIGAHIGTTALAYIISINVSQYCLPLICIGAFIVLMVANRKAKLSGRICLGIGFIFLGLEFMSISFGTFAKQEWFTKLMEALGNNLFLSFITGTALTALIQSSGAFIGIVQELYSAQGSAMILSSAIALTIGSNIGTSITAFIASLSGNKVAKEAAIANTLFITIGALIFLPFTILLSKMFQGIENSLFGGSRSMLTIAFFHTFFNVINSAIALSIMNPIVKLVQKIIPDKGNDLVSAQKLNKELLKNPSLALEAARNSIVEMSGLVLEMYNKAIEYFNTNNHKIFDEINAIEDKVDLSEHLIHDYLMAISEIHLNKQDSYLQTQYIDCIRDFERIGDHATNFAEFLERYYDEKVEMSTEMHDALLTFFNIVGEQISDACDAFVNNDKQKSNKVVEREKIVDQMEEDYRHKVHSYNKPGEVNQLDILYIDIVSNLERISDHTTNICELVIDPHMASTIA